jgi:acyl-CoA thioesterase FadM
MPTTREDIQQWIDRRSENDTHMIVVTDTFDYEEYPVFVKDTEDVTTKVKEYNSKSMQNVIEVYSFTGKYPIESQLREYRSYHLD